MDLEIRTLIKRVSIPDVDVQNGHLPSNINFTAIALDLNLSFELRYLGVAGQMLGRTLLPLARLIDNGTMVAYTKLTQSDINREDPIIDENMQVQIRSHATRKKCLLVHISSPISHQG